MKSGAPDRRILHIDLDPFFIAVERSLDRRLRDVPLVVGGDGQLGFVAAASIEARKAGVRSGLTIRNARKLCPQAVFRAGDFETYARVSQDVTQILLTASRRVERPSADEAYVELAMDLADPRHPFRIVDRIQDEIRRRLGLEASFGLAATRLAARLASRFAKPHGFLVLLPGHESSFVARQPLEALSELAAAHGETLRHAGVNTLGDLAALDHERLVGLVGPAAAAHFIDIVSPGQDTSIPVATPPTSVHESASIRDRRNTRADLESIIGNLCQHALKRIRPFDLRVIGASIEIDRVEAHDRRSAHFRDGVGDKRTLIDALTNLARPLLVDPRAVRALHVRIGPLTQVDLQYTLFPELNGTTHAR